MKTLLCFGDSNTWGSDPVTGARLPHGLRWTGRLAAALAPGVRVIEEGLPGRTTVLEDPIEGITVSMSGAAYLRPCLASHRPIDAVLLMLGTNDLKARFRLSPFEIAQGLAQLVRMIQGSASGPDGRAPAVVLVAPTPILEVGGLGELFAGGAEKARRLAGHVADVAHAHGCTYVDASTLWTVSPVDGIHFDADAHAAFAAGIEPVLRGLAALR